MYFLISCLAHLVLLIGLIMSVNLTSKPFVLEQSNQNTEIINASVMAGPPIPKKIAQQKPAPLLPKPKPIDPEPIKPIPPKVEAKVEPIKPKVEPKPEPVKKVIALDSKKEKKKQKEKIEQQLLSDLEKEVKKPTKKKHADIAKEFEKEMKSMAANSLAEQMRQEAKRIEGAKTQAMQGVVNKYMALIQAAINQNWILPGTVDKKLYAELLIRVAPGGTVLDASVTRSSGNVAFDRSARTAVFKSSPLPVPSKQDEFESFREFVLKVKPENIVT